MGDGHAGEVARTQSTQADAEHSRLLGHSLFTPMTDSIRRDLAKTLL
jgi:hypothetical protein